MMTRTTITYESGHSVVPYVRVAAGKATLLELNYVWEGTAGKIPGVVMDLASDAVDEKAYMAAVYQGPSGERKVVLDSGPVTPGLAASSSSADSVLAAEGWARCFLIFQVFVPAGLQGSVEEDNSIVQVFEFASRSPNV